MQVTKVTIEFTSVDGKTGTLEVPEGDLSKARVRMEEAGVVEIQEMMSAAKSISKVTAKFSDGPDNNEAVQDPNGKNA